MKQNQQSKPKTETITITATEVERIILKHLQSMESQGDTLSCLDMMQIFQFTHPFRQAEFMALPLTSKCGLWREQGKPEGFIVNLCVDMLNAALGDGWRDDPAIKTAMNHPNPTDLLKGLE